MDEAIPRGSSHLGARYSEGDLEELLAVVPHIVVPHIKVFPKGLPSVENFDVVFQVGSRRRL
jgi:hypothetical protein